MKIAIDISQIIYGTGVSVYTKELITNLFKIDPHDQFILFGGSLRRQNELRVYTNKVFPLSPTIADFLWNRLHIFNIERLIGKIDVLHSSDWTQPPTNAFKVTTVHDLAFTKFPNETPKKIIEVHKRRLYWVLKEVDRIIVPTYAIKNDLVALGAKEEKIRVIYEGVNSFFKKRSVENIEATKKELGIHEDYILSVGIGERKNTKRIIEGFQKSKKKFKLVVVGGNKRIETNARGIIYTGFISDEDLVNLYSGAKALIYPSLYEGFGLPILQAFACECPVVTSDRGSMKEIAQNAAVLVDPYDISSISQGINKAVASPKTFGRKGLKRVKDFNWEKCARQTLEVYREATSSAYKELNPT